MSNKKGSKVIISLFIILLICIGIAVYFFYSRINKEINSAKEFVQLLYDEKMIDTSENINDIKYEAVKQIDGDKENYRVTSRNFGFDLNSDYKVIGFNYNSRETTPDGIEIGEEKARVLAEEYIEKLSDEDYKFKSIIEAAEGSYLTYYGYLFTRYKDGYPFYNDQIMIQIDKYTGYLTGYSNSISQGEPKKININVELDGAENIAVEVFNQLNSNGIINKEEISVAFADNKEKTETELCYIIVVSGQDADNKEVKWKYFISTDTGEAINSRKDTVSKSLIK